MKKILFLFTALLSMSASVMADGLTATLQQGDSMTPFYGVDAFKQAYEAAQDGAVITLSSGKFNDVSSIDKSITIVGAYAFGSNGAKTTSTTINADNVKIEGISFSGNVTIGGVSNCHLKRSCVWGELTSTSGTEHVNTLIDQCLIKADNAISNGKNYCMKNCTIGGFLAMNTVENFAYVSNCYVCNWFNQSDAYKQPYAIYKNNVLCCFSSNKYYQLNLDSPSEYYYNYFYRNFAYVKFTDGCIDVSNNIGTFTSSLNPSNVVGMIDVSLDKIGQDGTPIGITGGTGFSEYPAIPRITSQTISSITDAEGRLNVKVAVEVQK